MIIGGDNTSDRFGSALAGEILKKCPQASLFGVGGPLLEDAGVRLLYDISEMVSLGVIHSIKGTHVVKRLIKRVSETIDKEQPNLVVQIGLPVFGLRLLELVQTKEIPVLYYYTPLSRGMQNVKMGNFSGVVTKVAGISRFETAACEKAGIEVEFVGHPLVDLADFSLTKAAARLRLGIENENAKVIGVLPGARETEVKNLLPPVFKAIGQVAEEHENIEVVLSLAPTIGDVFLEKLLKRNPYPGLKLKRKTYSVLRAADLAVTSIGTCSLEASILRIPSLAVYRVPGTTYILDKLADRRPYMTTTNNILRKTVIPEFIQSDISTAGIAEAVERLLYDEQARQALLEELAGLGSELGRPGAVGRAANLVLEMAGVKSDEAFG